MNIKRLIHPGISLHTEIQVKSLSSLGQYRNESAIFLKQYKVYPK